MATFVHLTPEKYLAAIKRSGIKRARARRFLPAGVFAQAVTPNFYVSHQWLRELKRSGQRTLLGVYFRVPDVEPVYVGHYHRPPLQASAAEAIGLIMHNDSPLGYQVLIPRRIEADEIMRVRQLPQTLGWRYYPESHGKTLCPCPVCVSPGEINSSRKRQRLRRNEPHPQF